MVEITSETSGTGPRHLALSPDGCYLYVVNELECSVSSYQIMNGCIGEQIDCCTIRPEGMEGDFTAADIHVSPDGKNLYATIRQANRIATFSTDNGKLKRLQLIETRGDVPRSFAIHPNGKFLLLSNQNSHNLILFRIGEDGLLDFVEEYYNSSPVCVKIYA